MPRHHSIAFRLFSAALAAMLIISSVGIAIEVHSCKGDIQSIGIYAPSHECDMRMDSPDGAAQAPCDSPVFGKQNCCSTDATYTNVDVQANQGVDLTDHDCRALEIPADHLAPAAGSFEAVPNRIPGPIPIGPRQQLLYQCFLI